MADYLGSALAKTRARIEREKAEAEANARARTFNPTSLAAGALTLATGGGAAPLLAGALGEGLRASTGSDIDYGKLFTAGTDLLPELTPADFAKTANTTGTSKLLEMPTQTLGGSAGKYGLASNPLATATPQLADLGKNIATEPSMLDKFGGYLAQTWNKKPSTAKEREQLLNTQRGIEAGTVLKSPKLAEGYKIAPKVQAPKIVGESIIKSVPKEFDSDGNVLKYSTEKIPLIDTSLKSKISQFQAAITGRKMTYDQIVKDIMSATIGFDEDPDVAVAQKNAVIGRLRNVAPRTSGKKKVKWAELINVKK